MESQRRLLLDAAIKVVRASAIGDQNFIPCLMDNDEKTIRLRLAIYELAQVITEEDK